MKLPPSIMGNADAQLVLQENGGNVFVLDDITMRMMKITNDSIL